MGDQTNDLNTYIPLMGLESPSGTVHIAGDPLLCGAGGNFADWFECDFVPLRHVCQRCLSIYLANLQREGGGG